MKKTKRNALLFGSVFLAGTAAVAADHVAHRGLSNARPASLVAGSATCAALAPCAAAAAPCAAGASPCSAGAVPVAAPAPASAPPPRIAGQPSQGPRIVGRPATQAPAPRIAVAPAESPAISDPGPRIAGPARAD
jgi:hypothetical protein